MTTTSSPRRVLDQPPVEPDHVGIAFDAEALIGAVEALQVVRIGVHRREAENLVGDPDVMARIGRSHHQSGRHDYVWKNLADGAVQHLERRACSACYRR